MMQSLAVDYAGKRSCLAGNILMQSVEMAQPLNLKNLLAREQVELIE